VEGFLAGRYDYAAKVGFEIRKMVSVPLRMGRDLYYDISDPEVPTARGIYPSQRYPGWGVIHVRYDGSTVDVGFDTRPGLSMDVPAYRDTQAYPFTLGGKTMGFPEI